MRESKHSQCIPGGVHVVPQFASAVGSGSAAMTSNPRARYSAVQLAPITPVPTTATRRTGLLTDVSLLDRRCIRLV